jgi:hypothetical protein
LVETLPINVRLTARSRRSDDDDVDLLALGIGHDLFGGITVDHHAFQGTSASAAAFSIT